MSVLTSEALVIWNIYVLPAADHQHMTLQIFPEKNVLLLADGV